MEARQPLLGICTLVSIVSMPLFLRLVGINSVYGLRTSNTLSSPEAWYQANAFMGWALLFGAVLSAGLLSFAPGASRLWQSVVYFVAPIVLAMGASIAYASRLS
jgi:uncharacterized membrane protein